MRYDKSVSAQPLPSGTHLHIRHGMLLSAFTGIGIAGGAVTPSAGVYYCICLPHGWTVAAYRYADTETERDHSSFWEDFVAPFLATAWSKVCRSTKAALIQGLTDHPYAFPRGRVALVHGVYHVYHGSDHFDVLGIKRKTIKTIFGIEGVAKWREDDHERCLTYDKVGVRELLALEDDWASS